jgi:UDP:flavonoid glycosyltransferase YjiC (YdhE family)
MARILLTWELGGALGHLMSLRPLAIGFLERGHEVFLAARDLSRVRTAFAELNVTLLQAPSNTNRSHAIPVATYADLLLHIGFADANALACHVDAWQTIFKLIKPDLIVCDHSPTALLAARGDDFVVTTAGTGFFCPVDEAPLRLLRPLPPEIQPLLQKNEKFLLETMNRDLQRRSLPPFERAAQLYHDRKIYHFLLTFEELDHFTGRRDAKYWGTWPFGIGGKPFERPATGACVFAYLKPFPALMNVLEDLSTAPFHTVAYVDSLKEADRQRLQSDRLTLPAEPINIAQAAAACDLALTNATHGTCIAMLLQGKPLVHAPHFLEQNLFAAATERLGASLTIDTSDKRGARRAVEQVLTHPQYRASAACFSLRYSGTRFDQVADQIINEMELLLRGRSGS